MKKCFNLFLLLFLSGSLIAQNQCNLPFSLGNDTTLTCGQNFVIHAPQGLGNYAWSTGATSDSIVVTQSGTYTCYATQIGTTNLITNGDFSAGNTDFQSDYTVPTPPYGAYGQLSAEATYAIASDPHDVHNNFVSGCYDHTVGTISGKMMVVNGASVAGVEIWRQTITVQPNTNYQLSFWGMSVTSGSPGKLQFSINGTQVGSILSLPATTCDWQQFFVSWNSGTNTSIQIAIINQNTAVAGNDFALDDISFNTVCTYQDDIVVTMPAFPVVTASPTQTICAGDSVTLTAQSSSNIVNYAWSPNGNTGASILVHPTQQTVYSVVGTDDNGCASLPAEAIVNVNPLPIISMNGVDTVCTDGQTTIYANSSIPNSTYNWLNDNSTADSLTIIVPNPIDIIVEVTSPFNCSQTDTIQVATVPHLDVTITGNTVLCDGETSILNASSNLPNTSFTWLPTNMSSTAIQVGVSDTGYVYLKGNQALCGTDLDSVLISAGQIPSLTVPNNDTICLGDLVNAVASSDMTNATITWLATGVTGNSQQLAPKVTTSYFLQANVGNCVSPIDSFQIYVRPICDLQVPNIFTPNGDGVNDAFHLVKYAGIKGLSCVILNRWGNLVAEFKKADFQWTGKNISGTLVDDGVYFYKIKATLSNGEVLSRDGYVHLVK